MACRTHRSRYLGNALDTAGDHILCLISVNVQQTSTNEMFPVVRLGRHTDASYTRSYHMSFFTAQLVSVTMQKIMAYSLECSTVTDVSGTFHCDVMG